MHQKESDRTNHGRNPTCMRNISYEFSDLTFRYPFHSVGNYVVTLKAKINGDPKYQDNNPLISNFDISVSNLCQIIIPFSQLMLYFVTPSTAAIAGITIHFVSKKKKSVNNNNKQGLK
jgi:hypothetical protein